MSPAWWSLQIVRARMINPLFSRNSTHYNKTVLSMTIASTTMSSFSNPKIEHFPIPTTVLKKFFSISSSSSSFTLPNQSGKPTTTTTTTPRLFVPVESRYQQTILNTKAIPAYHTFMAEMYVLAVGALVSFAVWSDNPFFVAILATYGISITTYLNNKKKHRRIENKIATEFPSFILSSSEENKKCFSYTTALYGPKCREEVLGFCAELAKLSVLYNEQNRHDQASVIWNEIALLCCDDNLIQNHAHQQRQICTDMISNDNNNKK
jgi:hypothetical protein